VAGSTFAEGQRMKNISVALGRDPGFSAIVAEAIRRDEELSSGTVTGHLHGDV